MVLLNALLGAGDSRIVMVVSIGIQWFVQLPLVWFVGPWLGGGLVAIFAVYVGARAGLAGVFATVWARGAWGRIEV
jgi:MATE family multidrug resistance protein